MSVDKKVCVVVPVHNRIELTLKFIENFSQSTYKNFVIVIVDDGSTDDTEQKIKSKYPNIVVLKGDGNLWWSGATNVGVRYAIENNFDYVLTINNDSTVDKDLLIHLQKTSVQNPNSIIGARVMIGETNKIWALGVLVTFYTFPFLHLNFHNNDYTNYPSKLLKVQALAGNGVLIQIEIFKKIGLYDEKWCPQYHGDTEFTYRAAINGYDSLVDMDAIIYNNEFVSNPKFSLYDELFSKKSPHYWRPVVKFYWQHVPFKQKLFFFKQLLWIPKKIIKKIMGR